MVRDATAADVDAMVELFHRRRLRYEAYSPIYWRPAADARERHRAFLELLVASPDVITLVADGGVLIGLRRPEDWLVDDYAVADDADWPTVGVALWEAARSRIDGPVTAVCGHGDVPKGRMLRQLGLGVRDEWWVGVPVAAADGASDDYAVTVTGAPPVYDPGGPVGMADPVGATDEAVRGVLAFAAAEGLALVVVPVSVADEARGALLRAHGFEIAADWYTT